jgi:hypothetical protein
VWDVLQRNTVCTKISKTYVNGNPDASAHVANNNSYVQSCSRRKLPLGIYAPLGLFNAFSVYVGLPALYAAVLQLMTTNLSDSMG